MVAWQLRAEPGIPASMSMPPAPATEGASADRGIQPDEAIVDFVRLGRRVIVVAVVMVGVFTHRRTSKY